MNYSTGAPVTLGDAVELADGTKGKVVCIIHTRQFSADYKEADWSYLKYGTLVYFENLGLVHYNQSFDGDVTLIARAS